MSNLGSSTNPPSRLFIGDGGASAPSVTFGNDTDTGIYRGGTNTVVVAAAGSNALVVSDIEVTLGTSRMLQIQDGTQASPGLRFNSDQDTGMWRSGANTLEFSTGGTTRLAFDTSIIDLKLKSQFTDGTAGSPAIAFTSDPDTGFYNAGTANTIRATVGGVQAFRLDSTGLYVTNQHFAKNGSSSSPGYAFDLEPTMGLYRGGTADLTVQTDANNYIRLRNGAIGIYVSGTEIADFEAANGFYPVPDNTRTLGRSGFRWTAVWAANGTIQTSHSSTKQNIIEVDPTQLEIPLAVEYDRDGRRWLGYLNDSLPATGRPDTDPTANYEQAVIGVLCAKLKQAFEEIDKLKAKIGE